MAKFKRRLVLVDRGVQWAIVRQSLLHWLGYVAVAALFLAVTELLRGGLKPWSEHWQAIWPLITAPLVSLIILLPLSIYSSFRFSNRFVGPVKRLRTVLTGLAEGKPFSPIKFRKGDYWQEMAEELNRAVEALSKQRLADDPAAAEHLQESCR